MEESNLRDSGPTTSRSATDSSRTFRDAVMGNKKPDRASLLLKNYLEATFKVNSADLTTEEISQRKLRAARNGLSPSELAERAGLLQGHTLISQWTAAQWAFFTDAEIENIGNTQFRDSESRYPNSIYLMEQRAGDFEYLFHNDDCLRRSRSLIEQAVWRCWSHLMGDVEGISGPEDLLRTVSRKSLALSAGVSRPTLRVQLKGPVAPLAGFFARLDAFPFLDQWSLSAAKSISYSVIHKKKAAVLRICAHPQELDISVDYLAFLLRRRLYEEPVPIELLSAAEEKFSGKVHFQLAGAIIPRSLLLRPSLFLPSGESVPLTFPDGPASCSVCHGIDHADKQCTPPPCDRPCGLCGKTGHFGLRCPSLRKARVCFFCHADNHLIAACPKMECKYCHKAGHRAADCEEAAAARIARAARTARVAGTTGAPGTLNSLPVPAGRSSSSSAGRPASRGVAAPASVAAPSRVAPSQGSAASTGSSHSTSSGAGRRALPVVAASVFGPVRPSSAAAAAALPAPSPPARVSSSLVPTVPPGTVAPPVNAPNIGPWSYGLGPAHPAAAQAGAASAPLLDASASPSAVALQDISAVEASADDTAPVLIDLSHEAVGSLVALTPPAPIAALPVASADSTAPSTLAATVAQTSAAAHPAAAVGPEAAPASGIEAAVSVAAVPVKDPADLLLPEAASGSAASIAASAASAVAAAAPQAAALTPLADKDFAEDKAGAVIRHAENLARGRANLSDSDTEASSASGSVGRGGARRSTRLGLSERPRDLTKVSEGDTIT